jgi:hypothetical protein
MRLLARERLFSEIHNPVERQQIDGGGGATM